MFIDHEFSLLQHYIHISSLAFAWSKIEGFLDIPLNCREKATWKMSIGSVDNQNMQRI